MLLAIDGTESRREAHGSVGESHAHCEARTPAPLFAGSPTNSLQVRHAFGDPTTESRPYFGNTGLVSANGVDYLSQRWICDEVRTFQVPIGS
jgi:hypothetical protein